MIPTLLTVMLWTATALTQPARPEPAIETALKSLAEAQRTFDVPKLDALFAPDYIEISPAGEVDPRAKVLTFYAPEKKVAEPPAAELSEIMTRVYGDTAVSIARLTYSMKGPNGVVARSMRCVFVTRLIGGRWLIASTQYTPMRN